MTSAPAAIKATFSDFRLVKGRKVCQLVFETPIELADEALANLGGLPQPAEERWCGIARLTDEAAQRPSLPRRDDRPRRDFHTLSRAQQAGIKCADKSFQEYLGVDDQDAAARIVRETCAVASRSDLDRLPAAHAAWTDMLRGHEDYQRGYR